MKTALALALVLPLSGCATAGYRMGNFGADPAYEPEVLAAPQVVDADGAIIVRGASIYSGRRAMAVGDHLTVRIAHNTSADSKANTSTNKTSAAELGVSTRTLRSWLRASEAPENNEPLETAERVQLEQLRRENERLREELEILRKFRAFSAKRKR